ncbi:MAG: gliding motility protein GldC [Saprospiraceae bacterium]
MSQATKKSSIEILVSLNQDKFPETIEWKSSDGIKAQEFQEAKAILVSMFDKTTKDTLKIDLWTTEMQVVEMDRFMFQTLRSLGDTYYKSTGNKELAGDLQRFVEYFGQKTGIIPTEDS